LLALKSLSEWIEEDVASVAGPKTRSYLALMGQRADRRGMLLEGLLDFSRVGHTKAAPEAVDVAEMIASIVDMLAPPNGMRVRYVSEHLIIRTPRAPLVHVLQNLISNALKHHDRPAGEIWVEAWRGDGAVIFSVTDDGPGIPRPAHDRIFQMFQTLAPRGPVETSGVGLSIVKKTVERHGGTVWVESNPPARGAKFSFTWPETAGRIAPEPAEALKLPAE
jgi:signal transduction histidine kinase